MLETPPPAPEKRKSRKVLVIVATIVIATLGVTATILFINNTDSSTCLSASDFKQFTGYAPDEPFTPAENFYTDYVAFKDSSPSTYDDEDNNHGAVLITRIANFYKNSPKKSMNISITGDFISDTDEMLINQRIQTIYQNFLIQGVNDRDITVESASYTTAESEDDEQPSGNVYVIITGSDTCK